MLDTNTVNMNTVDSFVLHENDDENEYEMVLHSFDFVKKKICNVNEWPLTQWFNDSYRHTLVRKSISANKFFM